MATETDPPPAPASSSIPTEESSNTTHVQDEVPSLTPPPPPSAPASTKPTSNSNPNPTALTKLRVLRRSLLRHVLLQLQTTDSTLIRFSKLLSRPGGLSAFLSTLQYTIYLLAYLTRGIPLPSTALASLSRYLHLRSPKPTAASSISTSTAFPSTASLTPTPTPPTPDLSTSLTRLGSIISETRCTLRLFSLAPLYSWTRSLLLTSTTAPDRIIHNLNLLQALSYILFQALENMALLSDKRVLTPLRNPRGSTPYWLWSARLWAFGVFLDFVRLAREAQLDQRQDGEKDSSSPSVTLAQEDKKARHQKWCNELWTASCWFPVCVHWSLEGGLKGMNGGVLGILGLMAELRTFRNAWASTLD